MKEQLAENHRKMLMAMSQDIRVILVKLADRLHNMRTLKHLRKDKQERISQENHGNLCTASPPSRDFQRQVGIGRSILPLSERSRVLQNFPYDEGEASRAGSLVEEVVQKIESYAAERHLYGKIYGRPKHIYSIYRKMQDKKKRFDEIYDLIAIRCILESPK